MLSDSHTKSKKKKNFIHIESKVMIMYLYLRENSYVQTYHFLVMQCITFNPEK